MEPKPSYLYLYAGQGANTICVEQTIKSFNTYLGDRYPHLIKIDASHFIYQKVKEAAAIIMPGGSAATMFYPLMEALPSIRNLVLEKKVPYIGFCAGALLANDFDYTLSGRTTRLELELQLSDLDQRCPAYPLNNFPSSATAKGVPVAFGDQLSCHAFWNSGGCFPQKQSIDCDPLATYIEAPKISGNPVVAALGIDHKIAYCHVHPEIRFTEEELNCYNSSLENKEAYLQSQDQQEALFDMICSYVGLQKNEKEQGLHKVSLC